ncbi:SGNH/GDSL hydrolase family protein, partial [Desulfobacterales bacterium HSG16]|nr:SGNH/GDSL hydrolase family protein [Desulfobacterales bacterium HSG16]
MAKKCVLLVCMFALFSLTAYATEPVFETYVALGDSLTHGYQSGSVDETRQPCGYASLLAEKMGTEFNLPLLKFPGYMVNIEDVGKGNISWWKYYYPLVGGVRVDGYRNQDKINNFGITGATAAEAMTHYGSEGGFFELVLGKNGDPALDQALAKNPTFVSVWLGNNDVLGAALSTDTAALTPIAEFEEDFETITNRIASKQSIQGVVIMNVPDVTCIAYLNETNNPDFPQGSYNPFWLQDATEGFVLTPDEIALIQERAAQINEKIYDTAYANGWAHVDTYEIFMDMKTYGHELKDQYGMGSGEWISADYLGGVFSLDGVHPSITGQAVAANYVIEGINATYGTQLDYVNEYQTSQSDSLLQNPYDPRELINGWIG